MSARADSARLLPTPDGAGAVPELAAVSRWTARAQRRRRRLLRSRTETFTDVYTGLLTVIVLGAMALQALGSSRPEQGVGTLPGAEAALAGASPGWLAATVLLLGLAALAGSVRRLGPVVLRPEQAGWWLPLPGARQRLLAVRLWRTVAGAVVLGLCLGALPALIGGGGPSGALAGAVLCAGGCLLVLVGAADSQIGGRGVALVRASLLACATVALVLALTSPYALAGSVPVLALGIVLALTAVGWLAGVLPRLEQLGDAELIDAAHRAFGVSVAGLSLDTRALGRLLAPPERAPRRLSGLPLAHLSSQLAAPIRTVLGVAQADALLMRRQPWRLAQLGASALVALVLLAPGLGRPAQVVVVLVSVWSALLAAAAPARQAAFDGGPDQTWPASPSSVRLGHLLTPTAWMALWSVLLWGIALAAGGGAGGRAGLLGLVCLLSSIGWGAVAVRSGMRRAPDWSLIVPTPFGSLPAGVIQSLVAGPDAAVLVALPLLAVVVGGWSDPTVLAVQAGTSAAAVVWALLVGRDG